MVGLIKQGIDILGFSWFIKNDLKTSTMHTVIQNIDGSQDIFNNETVYCTDLISLPVTIITYNALSS